MAAFRRRCGCASRSRSSRRPSARRPSSDRAPGAPPQGAAVRARPAPRAHPQGSRSASSCSPDASSVRPSCHVVMFETLRSDRLTHPLRRHHAARGAGAPPSPRRRSPPPGSRCRPLSGNRDRSRRLDTDADLLAHHRETETSISSPIMMLWLDLRVSTSIARLPCRVGLRPLPGSSWAQKYSVLAFKRHSHPWTAWAQCKPASL